MPKFEAKADVGPTSKKLKTSSGIPARSLKKIEADESDDDNLPITDENISVLTFGVGGISKSTPDGEVKYWGDAEFISKEVNQLTSNGGTKF